jgi:hypothetical protein
MSTISLRYLRKEFDRVKQKYFPRWDKKGLWKVCRGWPKFRPRRAAARCYFHKKRIAIFRVPKRYTLEWLLIHEICHVVTRDSFHGIAWLKRMAKAAEIAPLRVKKEIEEDIKQLQCTTKRLIYDEIWYLGLSTNLNFNCARGKIMRNHGLSVTDLRFFPRLKFWFDNGRRIKLTIKSIVRETEKRGNKGNI